VSVFEDAAEGIVNVRALLFRTLSMARWPH
jgi:hypothetical protein